MRGRRWRAGSAIAVGTLFALPVAVVGPPGATATTTFTGEPAIATDVDGARSVVAADLDGDGDLDLAAGMAGAGEVIWYENDGDGTFGTEHEVADETFNLGAVAASDLDGDGDQDLVAAYGAVLVWFENTDSGGTFSDGSQITMFANGAQSIVAADLDGDGDIDLASANTFDFSIGWYENTDGDGTFTTGSFSFANSPISVAAADLDGDGDIDLASANEFEFTHWFENTDGDGTFSNGMEVSPASFDTDSVIAADLDGDGDDDLVTANEFVGEVVWHENTDGAGTFSDGTKINVVANFAHSVIAADVDRDGDPDLVSASKSTDTITWYENDGAGSFADGVDITTNADGTFSVAAADLDGDGDDDLVSANGFADTITWYRNDMTRPVVDAGGPYTVVDGQTVTLNATASDPDGGAVSVAWDFDGDGAHDDAVGLTPTFDAAMFGSIGDNLITAKVTDDESVTGFDTAVVGIGVPALPPVYIAPPGSDATPGPGGVLPAGSVLRVRVPDAALGRTVFGNLAAAGAAGPGFVTAYPCADGPPVDGDGNYTKADLNYNGAVLPAMSNRLVTTADANGDICFYTFSATALVIDVNATADDAITPIPNQRTDTRTGAGVLPADHILPVNVPEAVGGKTVIGNLASAGAAGPGFATAFPCQDGPPLDAQGNYTKADLNYNGAVLPAMSNRLVTTADANGDICFYTSSATALVIDVNATADDAITPIPNRRIDTRVGAGIRPADSTLIVNVPEAVDGKTVFGNLASAGAAGPGFATAFPCADGPPVDDQGTFTKADLNFNGNVLPAMSNRLIATADANGDICFYTSTATALVIDINATADDAITPIPNQRTDTRIIDFT